MTSVLDSKARIVIPAEIRDQVALLPGDRVELKTSGKTIVVSKIPKSRNKGLVALLVACPVKDFMPKRRKNSTRPPKL